ncbi:hypothetical protein Bca4012_019672 [Brassica carinata]|uniref:F-box domain-containing protein n=1 Tax=Brassica carinata TaxID=52824 RepID=A0A8X7WJG5_BRACI|nr:hypothetical protein Bca52824_001911 [Brassica carinata]
MASSSSSGPFSPAPPFLTTVMKEGGCINWAELPYELKSSILSSLCTVDVLENAQKVCTSWRHVCKDPKMWQKIDMVDRSQGGLVEIDISYFGTDSLLNYFALSSSNLRSLKLALVSPITTEGLTEALVKLPLLEDLEVAQCTSWGDSLKLVGQSCPKLKTLKLHSFGVGPRWTFSDDDALAVAETMPGLRNLQLFGNGLSWFKSHS